MRCRDAQDGARTQSAPATFSRGGRGRGSSADRLRQRGRVDDTVAKNALEVPGIVRMNELARTRQMQVVEPGQPEAQRRGAKQRGPLRSLVGGELAPVL